VQRTSLCRIVLFDRHREYAHADEADQACHPKGEGGRDLPEQSTNERSGNDGTARSTIKAFWSRMAADRIYAYTSGAAKP